MFPEAVTDAIDAMRAYAALILTGADAFEVAEDGTLVPVYNMPAMYFEHGKKDVGEIVEMEPLTFTGSISHKKPSGVNTAAEIVQRQASRFSDRPKAMARK